MALLTKDNFKAKYLAIFGDNTSREISEEDLRDFATDIADSWGEESAGGAAIGKKVFDGSQLILDNAKTFFDVFTQTSATTFTMTSSVEGAWFHLPFISDGSQVVYPNDWRGFNGLQLPSTIPVGTFDIIGFNNPYFGWVINIISSNNIGAFNSAFSSGFN